MVGNGNDGFKAWKRTVVKKQFYIIYCLFCDFSIVSGFEWCHQNNESGGTLLRLLKMPMERKKGNMVYFFGF